jgi:hypothetical protein
MRDACAGYCCLIGFSEAETCVLPTSAYSHAKLLRACEDVTRSLNLKGDVVFCHGQVDPFEPEIDWFTRDKEIHPLSAAPEPKRRFMPSKWEEKKCALIYYPYLGTRIL